MKTLREYPAKFHIGNHDGQNIYLSAPSWDCGWYWGFGYLGNSQCHYHVDGLKTREWYDTEKKCFRSERRSLYDGFREHFGSSLKITSKDLWTLCELFTTFYVLRETAEVLGRGGAHQSTNPLAELIKNPAEVERINGTILPAVFDEIYKILENAEANFTAEREANKAKLIAQVEAATTKMQTKRDGLVLLIENDIDTENVIYYDHTDKFCFGWRKPLSADDQKALLGQLNKIGFVDRFAVEFKGA